MKVTDKGQVAFLIPEKRISREMESTIYSSVRREREVTVVYGSRQVGKSTLAGMCIEKLLDEGEKDIFYFSLDKSREEFSDPDAFLEILLSQQTRAGGKIFVFLDEAQRIDEVGMFIKYLFDANKNLKFVLIGSASLEIKQKIKEPLTGRKYEYYLSPVTLSELISYRGFDARKIKKGFPVLDKILEEYLIFGGYPQVLTTPDPQLKAKKLVEIAETYIGSDTVNLFGIKNTRGLKIIASYLAGNVGNLYNRQALSRLSGMKRYEVEEIENALNKSFVVFFAPPFARDRARELVHQPKAYFQDLGIRNAYLGKIAHEVILSEKGQLFENAIAIQLASAYGWDKLKYWRTINQTEVDFVVERSYNHVFAFEAKYDSRVKMTRSLAGFSRKYHKIVSQAKCITRHNYWEVFAPVM